MSQIINLGTLKGSNYQSHTVNGVGGVYRCLCADGHKNAKPILTTTKNMENLKNYTDEELLAMVDAHDIRIRKLTPRECFRLMGVSEANIDKIQAAGVSKTQQYKMAGNSIVVHNLWHIFEEMFYHEGEHRGRQLSLFPLD